MARVEDNQIREELEKLRAELADTEARQKRLLHRISQIESDQSHSGNKPDYSHGINNHSSIEDKIKLYRSLFRGREDVYPRRFESIKTGKFGYQPACKNEWIRGICAKPKVKCSNCGNRDYLPLTDQVIEQHLRGENPDEYGNKDFTIGIYPMLPDEKCWFLAADFDKSSWQEDVRAFAQTCADMNIPVSIERSRSGNGAHVWLFFEEPIPCMKARAIASYTITETMERRPELGLDSYDRFFPNQDTLPQGGLGNLIALPLQKKPRENGNTEFFDENFVPYADQWQYFSTIQKIGRDAIEVLFQKACDSGRIIGLKLPATEEDDEPWETPPSGKKKNQIVGPFPQEVNIVLANQVFVQKADLSPSLRNALIRLSAFQNPEFYQKQAMRMPTYNIPRIICCAEDFDKYIALPRGCFDDVKELFKQLEIKVAINDKQSMGKPIDIAFNGTLYPEQKTAADALLEHDNGILAATTAFGKTVVACYILAQRSVNTLILVHRRQLQEQWKVRLQQFLDLDLDDIGLIGAGKRKPTGKIDIAIIQSLSKKGVVDDIVADYDHLIIDECHHISAPSFEAITRQFKGKYITGLSATVTRKDGHHPIIYMNCGPIRYRVCAKTEAQKRAFAHKLIVRNTNFELPPNLAIKEKVTISELYGALTDSIPRNAMILEDVMEAIYADRFPILLTERREHLEFLAEVLNDKIDNLIIFKGGMGKKQLAASQQKLESISRHKSNLILATGRYLGEGFDHPQLDTLFLALPVSWKGTIAQYAGRLHRDHHSKSEVIIYDYADLNVPMLAKMHKRRLSGYKVIGYEFDNIEMSTKAEK
ncbi:MAG: DEAD/DEAH box helicase [Phycisphaerae bacterium]|nr:DEAD/DEAH box helicase [Phycisphaerae bacterium]